MNAIIDFMARSDWNILYSLLFYTGIFTCCVAFGYLYYDKCSNKKTRFFWIFLLGAMLVLVYGLRYKVGTDYSNYVRYYNTMESYSSLSECFFECRKEKLYSAINYYFRLYFSEPYALFTFLGFVMFYCVIANLFLHRKECNIGLGIFVFIMLLYPISMNLVRLCLACCIDFFSIRYIYKKNFLKFSLCVLIAGLMHTTALIYFPFYFLGHIENKKISFLRNVAFAIVLITSPIWEKYFFANLTALPLISLYGERYADMINEEAASGWGFLLPIPITFVVLFYRKKILSMNPKFEIYINIFFCKMSFAFMGYFMHWANRLKHYPEMAEIIVVPLLLKQINSKRNRILFTILVMLYYLVPFVVSYVIKGNQQILPYRSIFDYYFY